MSCQTIINNILSGLLIPILPALAALIIAFLKKKKEELENHINNETVNKYIDLADNIIETAVVSVNQTFTDALKKSGTFDTAAAAEAFEKAKQIVLSSLGDAAKGVLQDVYGDLNNYITARIEYYVKKNKSATPQATT